MVKKSLLLWLVLQFHLCVIAFTDAASFPELSRLQNPLEGRGCCALCRVSAGGYQEHACGGAAGAKHIFFRVLVRCPNRVKKRKQRGV